MQYLSVQNKIIDFLENLRSTEGNFIYLGEKSNQIGLPNKHEANSYTEEMNIKHNAINSDKINQEQVINKEDWKNSATLEELNGKIHNCLKCPFGETRTHFVFGTGNPKAQIMLIGEAPGADEDLQGEPFVGRAGQLLTKILEAIHLSREDVYIANVVKCRPPGNKTPTESDFAECLPYLLKQIEIIKPKFILTLGAVPLLALLGKNYQISKHRGQVIDYNGIKLIPTYHPAYLLRNPSAKKFVWEDVQLLEKMYKEINQAG